MLLRTRLLSLLCVVVLLLGAAESMAQAADDWALIAILLRNGWIPTDTLLLERGFTRSLATGSKEAGCWFFQKREAGYLTLIKCQGCQGNVTNLTLTFEHPGRIVVPDGLLQALIAKGSLEISKPTTLTITVGQATKPLRQKETEPDAIVTIVEKLEIGLDGILRTSYIYVGVSEKQ